MTDENKNMSHGRLLMKFGQLGPYLRKDKSSEECYFFDCLSACVSAQKAPDKREFWGWWMEVIPKKNEFKYSYHFGKYDVEGNWLDLKLPNKCNAEVKATLDVFYQKISAFLQEEMKMEIKALSSLKRPKLKVAAQ